MNQFGQHKQHLLGVNGVLRPDLPNGAILCCSFVYGEIMSCGSDFKAGELLGYGASFTDSNSAEQSASTVV